MSDRTTRPRALRQTDAEFADLLQYGPTARAAVERLKQIAEEHATCAPPGKRKTKRVAPEHRLSPNARGNARVAEATAAARRPPETTYVVHQPSGRTYRTTRRDLAELALRENPGATITTDPPGATT